MGANNLDHRKGIDSLATKINSLEKQLRELRTIQQSSANGIRVIGYPEGGALSISHTLAAGDNVSFIFSIHPAGNILTNWQFFHSIFVDLPGSTSNNAYKLPSGASLSAGQKNIRMESWADWGESDDLAGIRSHYIRLVNQDSSPHNVVAIGKFYGPYIEVNP